MKDRFLWLEVMVETEGWIRRKLDDDMKIYGQFRPSCDSIKYARQPCLLKEFVQNDLKALSYIVQTTDRKLHYVKKQDVVFPPKGKLPYGIWKPGTINCRIYANSCESRRVIASDGVIWSESERLGKYGDRGITNLILLNLGYRLREKNGITFAVIERDAYDNRGKYKGSEEYLIPKPILWISKKSNKCEPDSRMPLSMLTGEF